MTYEWEPGTLKLTDYSFDFDHDYATDGTAERFVVSMTWDERADGWVDLELENSGFYDADDHRIRITDINANADPDEPVVEAVLLDANGYPLADGSTAEPLQFTIKDPVSFANLVAGF